MPSRRLALALSVLALAACSPRPPAPGTASADVADMPRDYRHRLVFDSVWAIVAREHVDSTLAGIDWAGARARLRERAARAGDERALYRVLGELLAPLADAHTYATPPSRVRRDHARRANARGEGLGLGFETLGGAVVVTSVQRHSTAGRAGVQPGWVVRSWNGMRVDSASFAAGRFGAGRGDTVAIGFADSLDAVVERVLIPATFRWRHPRGIARVAGVPVVRLTSFEPGTGDWFREAMRSLAAEPAVVLDLRGNPGGQMHELSLATSALFTERQLLGRFIARDGTSGDVTAAGSASAYRGTIVALVDRRSGSAAEILAAALQRTGRGRIVGERTAGAVLNAFPYRLPDGGQLHVSRRDFHDACDVRLEHGGVAPRDTLDLAPRTLDDLRRGRDRALERALAVIASGDPAPSGCVVLAN